MAAVGSAEEDRNADSYLPSSAPLKAAIGCVQQRNTTHYFLLLIAAGDAKMVGGQKPLHAARQGHVEGRFAAVNSGTHRVNQLLSPLGEKTQYVPQANMALDKCCTEMDSASVFPSRGLGAAVRRHILFSGGGPYVQQSHICARRSVLSASSNTVRMSLVCSLEACPADTQSALAVWKLHCSSAALLAPLTGEDWLDDSETSPHSCTSSATQLQSADTAQQKIFAASRGDLPVPNILPMNSDPLPEPSQTPLEPQLQMNTPTATDPDTLLLLSFGDPASTLARRLAATQACDRRNMLGEELYPHVQKLEPEPYLASKITGMLLEMPENEIVALIEDHLACQDKVAEALMVLNQSTELHDDSDAPCDTPCDEIMDLTIPSPGYPQLEVNPQPVGTPPLDLTVAHTADMRRYMLGEHLYPHVQSLEPVLACKITGMLLEMAESEIMALLENQLACRDKVIEAKMVLIEHGFAVAG
ncbi:hypothetical protein WJX82_007351 [Trebouxia sp. C0006]